MAQQGVQVTHELTGDRGVVVIDAGEAGVRRAEVDRDVIFDRGRLDTVVKANVAEIQREHRAKTKDQTFALGDPAYSKALASFHGAAEDFSADGVNVPDALPAVFGREQGIVMTAGPISGLIAAPVDAASLPQGTASDAKAAPEASKEAPKGAPKASNAPQRG